MKHYKHLSLLIAIAISMSVSAKAPPVHGVAKESKRTLCTYLSAFGGGPEIQLAVTCLDVVTVIEYVEPVRNWTYVDEVTPIYNAPHVERPAAFYARNSC